jgi:hypothetical protein
MVFANVFTLAVVLKQTSATNIWCRSTGSRQLPQPVWMVLRILWTTARNQWARAVVSVDGLDRSPRLIHNDCLLAHQRSSIDKSFP